MSGDAGGGNEHLAARAGAAGAATGACRLAWRLTWLVVGLGAIAAAGLGAVLPLLPTTPFVLLAAFAFARSSRRLHRWLLRHPVFGPLIDDWHRYGAIGRSAKVVSIVSMAGVFGLSLLLEAPPVVLLVQALALSASASFIVSRPLPPQRSTRG